MRIAFVGSGNVASSLAPALDVMPGVEVVAICSPTESHCKRLAGRLRNAGAITNIHDLPAADLTIVSVKDDALKNFNTSGVHGSGLWVHTSGAVGMEALDGIGSQHGVFYPLQTFTAGREINLQGVPMLIEAGDPESRKLLLDLGQRLTGKAIEADSELRSAVHLAAVFGCNFANHAWACAERLLACNGLPLSTLKPLIEETLAKALDIGATAGQTGPAIRGDQSVMEGHLEHLPDDLKPVYETMSQSIANFMQSCRK